MHYPVCMIMKILKHLKKSLTSGAFEVRRPRLGTMVITMGSFDCSHLQSQPYYMLDLFQTISLYFYIGYVLL